MIAIGCDHGGYELKEILVQYLKENQYEIKDMGCHSKEAVDYPQIGRAVATAVADGSCDKGIVICTTGIGISIAANKVAGIRAALCSEVVSAKMTRLHNDANVLALGAGMIGELAAKEIVDTFLETKFSGQERHQNRINQIEG